MAQIVSIDSKRTTAVVDAHPEASEIGESSDVPSSSAEPESRAEDLKVTPSAVNRIRAVLAKENISPEEGGLRVGVKGGGCSGLSYAISFDKRPRERDHIFTFEDVRVFIDPKSIAYLRGLTLDYEETLMRQGFNFLNPNSARSCGCGSSFSV